MLLDQFTKQSDLLALDDLSSTRSWRALYKNSVRLSTLIKQQGIEPGQHIALLMRNRVEFIEIVIASLLSGVWLTPINWHLTTAEVLYIIEDTGCQLIFSEDHFSETLALCAAPCINIDKLSLQGLPEAIIDLDQQPGAIMMYTSGTTGKPKGVKRSKPNTLKDLLTQQSLSGHSIGLDGSGTHLVTGPLYHAAPMLYALYDLSNGAPMIIMPTFDAYKALALINERRVTHSHWVPTMFVRALENRDRFADGFACLKLVLHGAAPISIAVKSAMLEWWGPVLVEYWGGTESGVVTRATSEQWLQHPGTVGKALAQFEVFAVDDEGLRLGVGQEGLLCVRHKTIEQPFTYHRDNKKTALSYIEAGVFSLGDIGRVDEQGFIYLLDRQSNMIISGGVNIYPAEIELVYQQHRAVADIAVFGIPNDEWGEEVKAVIELAKGFSDGPELEGELVSFGKLQLASYKIPRSFDFCEKLPRHETGKLLTRQLKQPYWQHLNTKI